MKLLINKGQPGKSRVKSQTEIDQTVLNFLSNLNIASPQDLVVLKDKILDSLETRPYNKQTKAHADNIQWKRTASEIISDGYVYDSKSCSDLAIIFLTLCKALKIEGRLVKLRSLDDKKTHTIVEVNLNGAWYRIDPSSRDSVPFKGQLNKESIWNKKFKVWKKGRDVWDLGLDSKKDEKEICKKG